MPITEDVEEEVPPEKYCGVYRTVVVGAGTTNFAVPKFDPVQMKRMCEELEREIAEAERNRAIDPFSIASKYSLNFVKFTLSRTVMGACAA